MAAHYYSLAVYPGPSIDPNSVTKATATQAANHIELRVDDGVTGNSKLEVLRALEVLRDYIVHDIAPA